MKDITTHAGSEVSMADAPGLPEPVLWIGQDVLQMADPPISAHRRRMDVHSLDGKPLALYTADQLLAGVVEALEAGHDALVAAATDYHASMAGYRAHIHKAMDIETASVKAVLERVRALAGKGEA